MAARYGVAGDRLLKGGLFCDRLPTKENLFRRRVIKFDAQMCVGEVRWRLRVICYFIVIFLGQFDTIYFGGLALLRLCLLMQRTTFLNLVLSVVPLGRVVQFYR